MVFVGWLVALVAFYFWVKGNWFVPLVTLAGVSFVIGNDLTWPAFFKVAAVCYAPIVVRFLARAVIIRVREEMGQRTFWRYMKDSLIALGDPDANVARRREAKAAWKTRKAARSQQKLLTGPRIEPQLPGSSAVQ